MVRKRPRIIEKKLGRENAWGIWKEDFNLIEIDPRHSHSRSYLNTCIHELVHVACPEKSEKEVRRITSLITNGVWGQNFRRIMK